MDTIDKIIVQSQILALMETKNKIQEKIDSGEIKESELMEEAKELMTKMKGMPGMKNFQDILLFLPGNTKTLLLIETRNT